MEIRVVNSGNKVDWLPGESLVRRDKRWNKELMMLLTQKASKVISSQEIITAIFNNERNVDKIINLINGFAKEKGMSLEHKNMTTTPTSFHPLYGYVRNYSLIMEHELAQFVTDLNVGIVCVESSIVLTVHHIETEF